MRRRYASASKSKSGKLKSGRSTWGGSRCGGSTCGRRKSCWSLMNMSGAGVTWASGYVTMARVPAVIDSDQHLYETRTMWLDHIDPSHRDDALRIVDDDLGYAWLSWGEGRKLSPVDVQHPGQTTELGERRGSIRAGAPPAATEDRDP